MINVITEKCKGCCGISEEGCLTYSGGKGTQGRLPREGNVQMRSRNLLDSII